MKKIKTVFVIDRENNDLATPAVTPGAEWIMAGEGTATLKLDGTPVLKEGNTFYRRYAQKLNPKYARKKRMNEIVTFSGDMFKDAPENWVPLMDAPDPHTGHWPGWVPLSQNNNDKPFWEAIHTLPEDAEDGTYELIGPGFQQNIYGLDSHVLLKHGAMEFDIERSFDGIKEFLETHYLEGIVFHHPDPSVPMFKVRQKDFGFIWNPKSDPRRHPNWLETVPVAKMEF